MPKIHDEFKSFVTHVMIDSEGLTEHLLSETTDFIYLRYYDFRRDIHYAYTIEVSIIYEKTI